MQRRGCVLVSQGQSCGPTQPPSDGLSVTQVPAVNAFHQLGASEENKKTYKLKHQTEGDSLRRHLGVLSALSDLGSSFAALAHTVPHPRPWLCHSLVTLSGGLEGLNMPWPTQPRSQGSCHPFPETDFTKGISSGLVSTLPCF